jgi:L-asparagine oxygenase
MESPNVRTLLSTYGFTIFRISSNISTLEIARSIGTIVQIPGTSLVQKLHVRDRSEAGLNVYSGNFGRSEFPLHSDFSHLLIPPRYILLRALVPAAVSTYVIRSDKLTVRLSTNTLQRALFIPRKRIRGKLSLLRALQKVDGQSLFRWDPLFLNPANQEAEVIKDLFNCSREWAPIDEFYLRSRDEVLLIDNWNCLHGRGSVLPESAERILERVYLSEIQ